MAKDDSLGLKQTQGPARVDKSALCSYLAIFIVGFWFVQQTGGRSSINRGN